MPKVAARKRPPQPRIMIADCANGNHGTCPGAVLRKEGRDPAWLCACDCHDAADLVCLKCGTAPEPALPPKKSNVDPERWVCHDRMVCQRRVEQRRNANPLYRLLQECRGTNMPKTGTVTDDGVDLARKPAKRKAGVCEHCGQVTKGGRFTAGHDAKLKSELGKVAAGNDRPAAEAYAEMIARGWVKNPKPEGDEIAAQAQGLVTEHGADALVASATASRLARLNGAAPQE